LLVTGITGRRGLTLFITSSSAIRASDWHSPAQDPLATTDLGCTLDIDAEDDCALVRSFINSAASLNAIGKCALKKCELDPGMAHLMNVASAAALPRTSAAMAAAGHLLFDLVYSGKGTGMYRGRGSGDP